MATQSFCLCLTDAPRWLISFHYPDFAPSLTLQTLFLIGVPSSHPRYGILSFRNWSGLLGVSRPAIKPTEDYTFHGSSIPTVPHLLIHRHFSVHVHLWVSAAPIPFPGARLHCSLCPYPFLFLSCQLETCQRCPVPHSLEQLSTGG